MLVQCNEFQEFAFLLLFVVFFFSPSPICLFLANVEGAKTITVEAITAAEEARAEYLY